MIDYVAHYYYVLMKNPIHISNFREVTLIIYHGNFVTFSVGTNGFHGPKNGGTDLSDIEIEEEEDDDVQVLQQVLFLHQHLFWAKNIEQKALCTFGGKNYENKIKASSLTLLVLAHHLHVICIFKKGWMINDFPAFSEIG